MKTVLTAGVIVVALYVGGAHVDAAPVLTHMQQVALERGGHA